MPVTRTKGKVAWIYINNRKVLATLSKGKRNCYIPGAKREPFESDIKVLCREIIEELNVDIDSDMVEYLAAFTAQSDGTVNDIEVHMTCYCAEFTGDLSASSEIKTIDWLGMADIDKISAVNKLIYPVFCQMGLVD